MHIDWFTFIAQILNFLVLVWLLKRVLYQPILNAIDAREKQVAAQLEDAARQKAEAETERETYQGKCDEITKNREALLLEAREKADAEQTRLVDLARSDADALRLRLQRELNEAQESVAQSLVARTRQEVFAIARKTLTDLGGIGLEERMAVAFLEQVNQLAPDVAGCFVGASDAQVQSAFELPQNVQTRLDSELRKKFQLQDSIAFVARPDIIAGIEFLANGHKVEWSIEAYLQGLEKLAQA
jgi:F-type H+-transporting ATPase subunit b